MIPLHSILAAGSASPLPTILFSVAGVLMALAFLMGFVKGFRKVSWDGLAWLVAGVVFIAIGAMVPMKGADDAGSFTISIVVAVLCALATFGVFGILSYFLRPKMRWIKDDINGDMALAEYGLEFEPEYLDYDGEHDYAPYGKRIYKTGYGTPCFFMRLLGGLTCAINIGIVLWALLSAFLMLVGATALKDMAVGSDLSDTTMQWLFGVAEKYLFDLLSIGIIMLIASKGYEKGLINSLRSVVITVGGMAAGILSFSLPFTQAGTPFIGTIVSRCTTVFASMGFFADILGKLLAGVCLLALFVVALVLLNVLLKKVCSMIESIGITRELDGCLAVVLYAIIGAAVCVGFWFLLAGLDVLGILQISKIMSEEAYLSSNLFNFAKSILEPLFAGTAA